ncbi:succinylglutamate desuccinylase/aspartoacylase family protein [Vibrio sp. SS-MA-C1-2]|uniref:succinylglutamate desuccinylase/aspartoacylase family protein n=1 Tax=Vibrio sp. SS-MA-C1-2 TaxID=2908646 RepID=UPI001F2284A5|nr:succinylglutamate desuccinylase/aspartoacylase family protein [Vibrio sp. SS-MA-C1-2]UJF17630.1 succinylglutamate desuccinylase/aspartoacylase family protein [Vibrio sp. SS-MA-C1-2]
MYDHPTLSQLDTIELAIGTHQFWFQTSTNGLGQPQQIPVIVFKGSENGKRVVVTAGLHGDELNGILTAQQLIRTLKSTPIEDIQGTIIVVPTINISGVLAHHRDFIPTDPDASPVNLNRLFPGDEKGNSANRFVAQIWKNLLLPNADIAIDLHTQTTGAVYPLYIFADFRRPVALEMAKLMNPDCIYNDPGDAGVLETTWNENGIDAITVEVGMGRNTEKSLIERAHSGIVNILIQHQVLEGELTPATEACFIGQKTETIRAEVGGFAISQVELLQHVEQGDLLSIQHDSFGSETARYYAPIAGQVLSYNCDSLREPGTLITRLLIS